MLRLISWQQFHEWQAYASLEPFDEERADVRSAQVTQAIVNMLRDPKKHRQPIALSEFIIKFGDQEKKVVQTWQQQKDIARLYSLGEQKSQLKEEDNS